MVIQEEQETIYLNIIKLKKQINTIHLLIN
jgi:hypothetical protein